MQSRDRWTDGRVARTLAVAFALAAATTVATACHHTATPAGESGGADTTASTARSADTTNAAATTTTTTTTTTSSDTSRTAPPPSTTTPPPSAAAPDTTNRSSTSSTSGATNPSTQTASGTGPNGEPADSSCSQVNGARGAQPQKPGADPLAVNQSEYDGWKMFHVYCYRCHGTDALGSDIAPNLRHSVGPEGTVDHACFIFTVTHGRPAKGMPTWAALLDRSQMENIYHYLLARSSGRLEPGRPHVAGASSNGTGR